MIMRLFALKGKTGYTKFDVETWREILKPYDEKKLTEAFSIAIQKEGFFEIKTVLDELKPNNEKIAINEWDKIMQIARDGGQGYDRLSDASKSALRLAGGLQQLRTTESSYIRDNMQKLFIDNFDVENKKILFNENAKSYEFVKDFSDKFKIE